MLAAAAWGSADFGAGVATRRHRALVVVLVSQVAGGVVALAAGLALTERLPTAASVGWAMAAGVFGSLGLAALYRALATGRMAVAAPVSGILAAAVPVAVGFADAGLPGPVRLAGFVVGLLAVVLVSADGDDRGGRGGVGLALLAGAAFGAYSTAVARVDPGSTFLSLAVSRATATVVVTVLLVASQSGGRPSMGVAALPPLILVGCLDMAGNASFVIAAQAGRLDVAAVLAALYPVTTVILAAVLLRERIRRIHLAGIAGACLAIVLIAGG